ncbi:DUF3619 family protein [Inhella proteolytica]|uniref:DUF3619 family protein n=1 Tax=Inhella proteolytica TaxID=2795029 RepID=A0A931J4W2_9BURK|nr:DUF3619 family protein [Inhella proteolytica]MBH9577843.1 DUF3619 family protein [Inhella proteolytica]
MKPNQTMTDDAVDQAGRALAQSLKAEADQLPPEIQARLEGARAQALAAARAAREASAVQADASGQAVLSGGPGGRKRFGAAWLPALVLVLGLVALAQGQWFQQVLGISEVDTELLKDQLPPNAYGDPGFNEYLDEDAQKTDKEARPEDDQKDEGA